MKLFDRSFFPVVFAMALPLTVYSHNQAVFNTIDVLRPTIALAVAAGLMMYLMRRLVKDRTMADALAALPFVGIWLVGFQWLLLVLLIALVALLRNRKLTTHAGPVLNALSIGVVLLPILVIIQVEHVTHTMETSNRTRDLDWSPFVPLEARTIEGVKPDIYHIVLDAYGGADALDVLDYDNSAFFNSLTDMGFVLNDSTTTPYNLTIHIMTAIFLGEYLKPNEFPIDSPNRSELWSTLGAIVPNGPVHRFLRANGYSVRYADPGHDFLRFPSGGELITGSPPAGLNPFELYLGQLTGLDRIFPNIYAIRAENKLIRSVKVAFDHDYADVPSPKFIYQHMMTPHTPFIIDEHGNETTEYPGFTGTMEGDDVVRNNPERRELYRQGYLAKLRYTNGRMLEQLERLMQDPSPKIIILHSDHGPGTRYVLNSPEKTCLKERYTSFLAVYTNVPEFREDFAWIEDPKAAPVNLYRGMFNALLDTDLELLPLQTTFAINNAPHRLKAFDPALVEMSCKPEGFAAAEFTELYAN